MGDPPIRVDHRKLGPDVCPYVSRFGAVLGNVKLKEAVKKAADIRDYCTHMYRTTKEAFAGTPQASTFRIYHDALQQFTCKDNVKYMKDTGIYDYFLWPVLSCNNGRTTFADQDGWRFPRIQ